MATSVPEIYYHVGLGKTASTFLQFSFFPKLRDVLYVQRNRFSRYRSIISRTKAKRLLFSREYDQQLEDRLRSFSAGYPDARVIIVLRRHDGWIASQYRRYVKNGGSLPFTGFIDVENDSGLWKRSDLDYMAKLRLVERYFTHPPFVVFHEDLKADPYAFFDRLAAYIGASYRQEDVSTEAIHPSYSEKQLRAIRRVSPYLFRQDRRLSGNKWRHWLQVRSRLLLSYIILYGALLIPDRFFSREKLIPPDELEKVRAYFADDWRQCLAYGREHSQPVGDSVV